jgi:hypothetical protein
MTFVISFVVATPPHKKMTMHYYLFLLLKHKEEGDGSCCRHLRHYNTTIEKEDGTLLSFFSQTQKKGNGS